MDKNCRLATDAGWDGEGSHITVTAILIKIHSRVVAERGADASREKHTLSEGFAAIRTHTHTRTQARSHRAETGKNWGAAFIRLYLRRLDRAGSVR